MSKLEIYYLAAFFIALVLIVIYLNTAIKKGWQRRNIDEFYLLTLGLLIGVLCTLNITGLCLDLFLLFEILHNRDRLMDKRKNWENIYTMDRLLMEKENEEASDAPRIEVMPFSAQLSVILLWQLMGGYCVLMKYTGDTGLFLPEQFRVWLYDFFSLKLGQNEMLPPHFLLLAVGMIFVVLLLSNIKWSRLFQKNSRSKESVQMDLKNQKKELAAEISQEEKPVSKPRYIENPLPLPKKHERRLMDFKEASMEKKDDFDFQISETDDFDL